MANDVPHRGAVAAANWVAAFLCLQACTELPALGPTASGAEPTLVPIDLLLAQADDPGKITTDALAARASRLQARAGLMRGPVLDPATRARLAAAIAAGQA
jgi:hypothetical protein